MILKVCGMKSIENMQALVSRVQPDWMGLIFYEPSPRNVDLEVHEIKALLELPVEKVGVFVNASTDEILEKADIYGLSAVQLHGDETAADCKLIRQEGLKVVKALPIKEQQDLAEAARYENAADYLLFDTKSKLRGGSGQQFDWSLLKNYSFSTPFLLSGGIGPNEVEALQAFQHPKYIGIDINSRFETAPGIKDIDLIKKFKEALWQKH